MPALYTNVYPLRIFINRPKSLSCLMNRHNTHLVWQTNFCYNCIGIFCKFIWKWAWQTWYLVPFSSKQASRAVL